MVPLQSSRHVIARYIWRHCLFVSNRLFWQDQNSTEGLFVCNPVRFGQGFTTLLLYSIIWICDSFGSLAVLLEANNGFGNSQNILTTLSLGGDLEDKQLRTPRLPDVGVEERLSQRRSCAGTPHRCFNLAAVVMRTTLRQLLENFWTPHRYFGLASFVRASVSCAVCTNMDLEIHIAHLKK